MRCNRKVACFAVTPHHKIVQSWDITEIGQLRRRGNKQIKIAVVIKFLGVIN